MDASLKRIERLAEDLRINAEGALHHQADAGHVQRSLAMIAETALTIIGDVTRAHSAPVLPLSESVRERILHLFLSYGSQCVNAAGGDPDGRRQAERALEKLEALLAHGAAPGEAPGSDPAARPANTHGDLAALWMSLEDGNQPAVEEHDERYCLACQKPGHRTDECHSTHGLHTPQARELFRLVRLATPRQTPADLLRDLVDAIGNLDKSQEADRRTAWARVDALIAEYRAMERQGA